MLPNSISVKGIDLHTNRFNVFHINGVEGKEEQKTYSIPSDLPDFLKSLSPEDVIVVEASNNTFAFAHLIREKVKKVHIVNPLDFKIIHETRKKTDKIDARKLARGGLYHESVDPTHLPLVTLPDKKIMELRSLFTTYRKISHRATAVINRIHSITKGCLKPYNDCDIKQSAVRKEIENLDISQEYKIQIKILYEELDLVLKHKDLLIATILLHAKYYEEEIKITTSIPGISIFIALSLKADYIDISRFKNSKHFCSYLRTAPKVDRSNKTNHITGLNKNSRKLSLSLLIQGLPHFYTSNTYLSQYRKKKMQGKAAGRVRIAMARKLLSILYVMLKRKELYRYSLPVGYARKLEELEKLKKTA